ncbi:MAG: hypothetical protein J6Y64_10600, partial [Ruminococcus sp.]|nr:hypothetical protein [Ruminococcus sp.]
MKSILKLMRAHIRHGKDVFFGIILLMSLLTFSFSGTVSNADELRAALEQNFQEAGVGDINVFIYDDMLTDEMLVSLEEDSQVEKYSTEKVLMLMLKPEIEGEEAESVLEFRRYYDDINVFNDSFNGFTDDNVLNRGEVFLPYKLKMNKKLKPGASISFTTSRGNKEVFTIKGYYEDPELGATTISNNRCVISAEDYDRLLSEELDHIDSIKRILLLQDEIHILGANRITATDLRRHITQDTALIKSANVVFSRQNIMDCFEMYSNTGKRGMVVFTLILLTVILITMHNSISASVEMEYTDLGILRSMGFQVNQIRLVYVAKYVFALIIGSILGILVSIPVCAVLIRMWMNITCILTGTSVAVLKCAILSLVMIFICIFFILIATSKIAHISPIMAISGGRNEVHFDSRLNFRIRKHSLSLSLVLRQLNTHRRSYTGTA